MTVARRDALVMLAGAGMAGSAFARTPSSPGLHALAAAKGMRFGSCVAWSEPGADRGSFENPAYAALLTRDCGLVVAEREMKWQALRPDADHFDFAHADAIVDGAEARRMAIRGHNLLWHQPRWMPHWLETYDFGSRPATEAERLLTTHITTVCGRYGQRIASYDVVNEAIDPADGTLHQTALSRAMGGAEATVDLAFRTARQAAPHAQLVYNDYMSWEPGNATHRAAVLRLLAGFRTRGVPVDALGIQSHITTQGLDMRASLRAMDGEWRSFLDAVTAMGYDLLITELDVRDNDVPVDVKVRDAAVADYTRAYLDRMFARPQLRDVLVWGMCDRYNWLTGLTPRPDRAPRRPSPYDRAFAAKPMRAAIAAAFDAAPRRPA